MIFKPSVDCVVFILALSKHGGVIPPMLMVAYYLLCGVVMRAVMPNFAKLTAITAAKEGDLRAVHSQIIQHAEEVAFYRGERTERLNADKSIRSVVKHNLHVKQLKSFSDFVDGLLIKYGATCVGYAVCSIGVFSLRDTASTAERTRVYINSSQLYIPLAQAIGKLVLLHTRITALAGYTARVSELKEFLDKCDADAAASASGAVTATGKVQEVPRGDVLELQHVNIAAPGAETNLINDLTLTVRRGKHLLIMGNNGSGKSALLRTVMGVWKLAGGTISRPPLAEICFVPQRTYLPRGTLRTQLIFPDTEEDCQRKGVTDDELLLMVQQVGLTAVLQREGGLNAFKEWHEVLSGGERQRFAFVRLLYHRPVFGIIDEATSAVSVDIEGDMYSAAIDRGITLITVSHREALRRFHDQLLVLDGTGGYTLTSLKS